jgi:putative ATPase
MLPLAARLRPEKLSEVIGQDKVLSPGSFLYEAIAGDRVPSLIFWGPPGSGKTTLALIIAKEAQAEFVQLNATGSGVKELRQVIDEAQANNRFGRKTIIFVDEIHRWNKAQQDTLLPHVERGEIILIGATTENPSFAVNSALISRSKVIVLQALSVESLEKIMKNALSKLKLKAKPDALALIAQFANGDARSALNILEAACAQKQPATADIVREVINKPHLYYDKDGEEHYNIISALHKSMRGGDPNASVYWLARILEAGEDPLYVARRLVRFASEDVGLANNSALMLVNSVFDACHKLGLPECKVHLAHAVIYLAKSAKSIAAYQAYNEAKREVEESGNLPVPIHLRNAPTKLMKELGYGKDYRYTPLEDSSSQEYLPPELKSKPVAKLIK